MDVVARQMMIHGTIAYESGRYRRAMCIFSEIIESEPDHWMSRFYLALCQAQEKQFCAARHELTFILEKCRDDRFRRLSLTVLKHVLYCEDSRPTVVHMNAGIAAGGKEAA